MTLEELLKKLITAPESLSKQEKDFLASSLKSLVSGKVPEGENMTFEQFAGSLGPALQRAMETPLGKQMVNDTIRDRQTERFVKRNKPFFDAILAGADIATSLSQIQNSNKAIKNLVKPTLPNPDVLDPAVNSAIADAQRGNLDALRALEPAKAEIAQQRLADMQTAKSVSGGQAGAYGSLATAAGLRANRAALSLPGIQDSIRARQQQRADSLIGLRQGVRQNEFNNRLGIADRNLEQYTADLSAASSLGQAGRTNLHNTLGQLPNTITRAVGGAMPVGNTTYDQVQGRIPVNGPSDLYSQYKLTLENSLAKRINDIQARKAIQFRSPQMKSLASWSANRLGPLPDPSYPQRLPY